MDCIFFKKIFLFCSNGLSAALGKPGLKTQVLTVGFDGSEGINLDDFELPQLKNDENAPLAHAAFSSFKNFFKNSSASTPFGEDEPRTGRVISAQASAAQPAPPTSPPRPIPVERPTGPNGKRKTMMRRRKVIRNNGTVITTTPKAIELPVQPEVAASAAGPKVIELDSSQIEKLIASGKIGPPKSITPGGPQIIELGQSELDALLSGDNAEEIKQILEGGDAVQGFDLSQITGGKGRSPPQQPPPPRIPQHFREEVDLPVTTARITESRPPSTIVTSSPPSTITTISSTGTTEEAGASTPQITPTTTSPPSPPTTTDLPIIYQYSSLKDEPRQKFPSQGIQGTVPLQFYSSHANGQQQARLVKTPTFELISAPPVSFSSSILPSTSNNVAPPPSPPIFIQQQQPFQNSFIPTQQHQQFLPLVQQKPQKFSKDNFNKIVPAAQTSSHTEQVKNSNNNFLQSLHKVNIPVNSVKLINPSTQQQVHSLNQVPASFQPSLVPNHVVNSPVLDSLRATQPQSNFLRQPPPQPSQQQNNVLEPFSNTQLFSTGSGILGGVATPSTRPPQFRFPTTSGILGSGGPNRFRTAESVNPFFAYQQQASGSNGFGSLVLNSFVAGDGLNYRPRSSQDFQAPGI